MKTPILIILILATLISACCSYDEKDFEFGKADIAPIFSFNEGDTIYYEGSNAELDTILIHEIEHVQKRNCGWIMAAPAFNNLSVTIKYIPPAKIWGGTLINGDSKETKIEYQELISIAKLPQSKDLDYSFYFKDFYTEVYSKRPIGIFRKDTVKINGRLVSNFYEIQHRYPEEVTAPDNIEMIYWTDNDGLLA